MNSFEKIKYFLTNKFCKNSAKKEALETERIKDLMHKYFDNDGFGLSREERKEVNNIITDTMVITDDKEIENFERFILTYMAVGQKTYKKMKSELKGSLPLIPTLKKSDALIVADKIIVKKPPLYKNTFSNIKSCMTREKIYTVKIRPDEPQSIQSFKFEAENEETKKQILKLISYFDNVESKAFNTKFHSL